MVSGPRVVLDANVLFPFTVRDTLLRAAALGFYQVHWSEEILDEATRNLLSNAKMNPTQAERLRAKMREAFPEALVYGYHHRVSSMPNDPKDHHVAAAAVEAGAELIVTLNLRDFKELPAGVTAVGPDEFLLDLLERDPRR